MRLQMELNLLGHLPPPWITPAWPTKRNWKSISEVKIHASIVKNAAIWLNTFRGWYDSEHLHLIQQFLWTWMSRALGIGMKLLAPLCLLILNARTYEDFACCVLMCFDVGPGSKNRPRSPCDSMRLRETQWNIFSIKRHAIPTATKHIYVFFRIYRPEF